MLYEKVNEAITEWDPLDVFPFAPKDEYNLEVNELVSFLQKTENCSNNLLGKKIYEMFLRTLGEDVFAYTVEDCNEIAIKILS